MRLFGTASCSLMCRINIKNGEGFGRGGPWLRHVGKGINDFSNAAAKYDPSSENRISGRAQSPPLPSKDFHDDDDNDVETGSGRLMRFHRSGLAATRYCTIPLIRLRSFPAQQFPEFPWSGKYAF